MKSKDKKNKTTPRSKGTVHVADPDEELLEGSEEDMYTGDEAPVEDEDEVFDDETKAVASF